ncbi:histidine phosphatase family protein [Lactobacillus johnsonii]|jgi:probable phosphoglycerate mutase|uniref:Histidine phosphatase family protein n=1 Tax=Lactobacillus johnsonii TaxID=33959 RepID=A0AAW5M5R5_LACJH|nr:histidine phosphatase family protein [Lactobacillus johnsonii]MCR1915590.1 histidine phosphatase family protein [Lactobacillus johnsonii]PJN78849.1 histidine phosphatase family protein [Lactobacillus johnsonii]TWU79449.1 putative phosphoserine phosphatase 2 [Lactobacillus johnsonii]
MRVVILRHGTTELNKQGMIQGSNVDPDLSKEGRAYAEKAAKNFDPSQFDAVYASPLKRAQQTARIFVGDKTPIITDKRIEELSYGSWDGKSSLEYRKKHPDAFNSKELINDNIYKYASDVEKREDFRKRIAAFFDDLYKEHANDTVLVVCHGVVSRMICAHFLTNGDIKYFDQMQNCGLAELDINKEYGTLVYYNRVLA